MPSLNNNYRDTTSFSRPIKLASSSTIRTMNSYDDDDDDYASQSSFLQQHHGHDQTTVWQTFVHLVKGYIGPGCLSLPWAMSQLGIIPGVVLCFGLCAWSSYNCWIVVHLKRQLMSSNNTTTTTGSTQQQQQQQQRQLTYPDVAGQLYSQ